MVWVAVGFVVWVAVGFVVWVVALVGFTVAVGVVAVVAVGFTVGVRVMVGVSSEDLERLSEIVDRLVSAVERLEAATQPRPRKPAKKAPSADELLSLIPPQWQQCVPLREWIEHKQESRHPFRSVKGVTACINQLKAYPPLEQRRMVDAAIASGWQGLHEVRLQKRQEPRNGQPRTPDQWQAWTRAQGLGDGPAGFTSDQFSAWAKRKYDEVARNG